MVQWNLKRFINFIYIYFFFYRYNDDLRNVSSELSRKRYIGGADIDKRNNVTFRRKL